MLKASSKGKKQPENEPDALEEGLQLVSGKLFKQATKAFLEALQTKPSSVLPRLQTAFNKSIKTAQFEAAISIGDALIQHLEKDIVFLINYGNSYRRLQKNQKANDLYRKALRIDKTNRLALLNLGASLAQVEKYDTEIVNTLAQFKDYGEIVLPPFLDNPNLIDQISEDIEKDRSKRMINIELMQEQKQHKENAGFTEEVKELIIKIENEERKLATPVFEETCKRIRKSAKKNWAGQSIEESKKNLQKNLFNLGIYALSEKDFKLASETFYKLKAENCQLENLDLVLSLLQHLEGKSQNAVEQLIVLLKHNPNNRLAIINLGLIYQKQGNQLLSIRYLLKADEMLERSEGLFNIQDIKTRAQEHFESDEYDKALNLYEIVAKEEPNAKTLNQIGQIRLLNEELAEATMAFHESLELEPKNSTAEQKLIEISDLYTIKADTQFRNGFYPEAIALYQSALEVHKTVTILKKAVRAFEKLNDFTQVNRLKSEIEILNQAQKDEQKESKRLSLLKQGRALLKQKKLDKAIELLEEAFKLKPDKDTFILLAHTLKAVNQARKLSNLVQQWRNLMERETKKGETPE